MNDSAGMVVSSGVYRELVSRGIPMEGYLETVLDSHRAAIRHGGQRVVTIPRSATERDIHLGMNYTIRPVNQHMTSNQGQ